MIKQVKLGRTNIICGEIGLGCEGFCKMSIEECKKEAEGLAKNGYQEIVLTGIHLSSYGKGEDYDLGDLILAIAEIPEVKRIRLGSMEPRMITSSFIYKIGQTKKLCPHFHLSLQSHFLQNHNYASNKEKTL